MKYTVKSDKPYSIEIEKENNLSDQFKIDVDGKSFDVKIKEYHPNGRIKTLLVNNEVLPIEVARHADGFPKMIYLNGLPFDVEIEKIKSVSQKAKPSQRVISGDIKSSLPGQVLSISVEVGDEVKKGQPLIILESMKMENEILAPKSGKIKVVHVVPGQVLFKDELILQIE